MLVSTHPRTRKRLESLTDDGTDLDGIVEAVRVAVEQVAVAGVSCPADYQVAGTSRVVVNFILSTVRRHHDWAGIRR